MRPFELMYLCAEPFLPVLNGQVRSRLRRICGSRVRPNVLDVGGRKSHYTIGVPANITIMDLLRNSSIQKALNLGMTDHTVKSTYLRRTNVESIVYGDMTRSPWKDDAFDCIVAVEVLEHVTEDSVFVAEARRVLNPGGIFLMTTPNGDFIPNVGNPDHKRHYTRNQLSSLLSEYFEEVEVRYAIKSSKCRVRGLHSWSLKHPGRTIISMASNLISSLQSSNPGLSEEATGTCHLIATARKRSVNSKPGT